MVIVNDPADSSLEEGSLIDREEFLEINKELKADGKKVATYRKTKPATFEPILIELQELRLILKALFLQPLFKRLPVF